MPSIYRDSIKSDIGLKAFDAAAAILRPRMIEDQILGFGTPSNDADAVEGVFAHQGAQFVIRVEMIK